VDTVNTIGAQERKRRFVFAGMTLLLLGLLTGFVVPSLANPRMGVSAHLEGVLNGLLLVLLGLVWSEVSLPPRAEKAALGLLFYGTYANWATTTLGAAFGTSRLTPVAGAGHAGAPWQEDLVTVLSVSLAFSMIAGIAVVLWGLGRPRQV
jgi:(hydroxyamino)benzene mutase